ncbi:hypothetical protein GCM10009621_11150 [Corynebacterium felinum]
MLIEDLRNKTEIFVHHHLLAITNGDTGGFLPPVLQGEKTEIGEFRNFFARCPNTEHAAFFAWSLLC